MKNNQQPQMSAQAAALVEKFYAPMPEVQIRVVTFYRRQLRVLDPETDPVQGHRCRSCRCLGGMPMGAPGMGQPMALAQLPAQLMQTSNQMPGVSAPRKP